MAASPTITDDQLRELFAHHCECRPLDLHRREDDHAAIHDCDMGLLRDIQSALGIDPFNSLQARRRGEGSFPVSEAERSRAWASMRDARARCAEFYAASRKDV